MFGVFLIVLVAMVGGLIAFIGDRVGMRVGRKRLTLFGLRPKYTSIGIAVLTGIITAGATLGILSAASENVRIALFHLTQIRLDLSRTQETNARLKADNKLQQAELAKVSEKWQTAREQLAQVNATLRDLELRIAPLKAARERAEKALQQASADYERAAADLAKVSAELAAANNEVKLLQQRKTNLEDQIALLTNQIGSLNTVGEMLGTGVVDFATQSIILHVNEVLAAEVVRPGLSFAETQALVTEILNRADRVARERGASIENKDVAIRVDMKSLANAHQILYDLQEKVILRIVSKTNTVAGRPAYVYLDVLKDEVVFHSGEEIAGMIVDGSQPPDLIFAYVVGDLFPKADQAALRRGMVDEYGAQPKLDLSFKELQEAVAAAAQLSARVKIKLTAARDLRRAGDNLALHIIVEKAS